MKLMNKYVLILLSFLIFSCKTDVSNKNRRQLELIPEPDILLRLESQKREVDSAIIKMTTPTEYIEIDDKQKPWKVIKKDDEEMGYQTQYYIYRDSSNNVRAIVEIPYSQSGDWFLEATHYFDKNEQVYAFQKKLNTFHHNETCGDDEVLFIRTIDYFDNGQLKNKTKNIQNSKGKEFKEDICNYQDIQMPIFKSLVDWSKSARIDLQQ